jgi:hypothetical protein
LKRLREEININYVLKGESKEHILGQEMVEITGHNLRNNCVGILGGMLGQIIMCF